MGWQLMPIPGKAREIRASEVHIHGIPHLPMGQNDIEAFTILVSLMI